MTRGVIAWELNDGAGRGQLTTYELIDSDTVGLFRKGLDELLEAGATDVELDMLQVNMLSSMAICVLIKIDQVLKERGGRLRLRKVHSGCLEVFSYMRLHELLDIEAMDDLILAI